MKGERLWKILAAGLSVAAVAVTLNTVLSAPRLQEILTRKKADLQKIQASQSRWESEDAYREWLDTQQAWKPMDLEQLAARTLGTRAARISPRPAVPAVDGWQQREVSVEIREASYDEVALFLSTAAETPPGWRLREIEIVPSAEAGQGTLTCVLEALEKKTP